MGDWAWSRSISTGSQHDPKVQAQVQCFLLELEKDIRRS